jgi:hypothetical protein
MHFRPLAGIIGLGLLASSHAQNKVVSISSFAPFCFTLPPVLPSIQSL